MNTVYSLSSEAMLTSREQSQHSHTHLDNTYQHETLVRAGCFFVLYFSSFGSFFKYKQHVQSEAESTLFAMFVGTNDQFHFNSHRCSHCNQSSITNNKVQIYEDLRIIVMKIYGNKLTIWGI